jgi:CheY-like chemotaxis protein
MKPSIFKDKTVLIVDDFKVNSELFSFIVAETGAAALTAANGRECIEIIQNCHVDMVLMDINMPVMNGIEAARTVRALPKGKQIPIVGISGDDRAEIKDACLRAGMNLVVSKLHLDENKLIEIAGLFFGDANHSARGASE